MAEEDDVIQSMALCTYWRDAGGTILGPVPTLTLALLGLNINAPYAAVLDSHLGQELVFPLADRLAVAGVSTEFFSVDFSSIPLRHCKLRRVEKGQSCEALSSLILSEVVRDIAALGRDDNSYDLAIDAALPRLEA